VGIGIAGLSVRPYWREKEREGRKDSRGGKKEVQAVARTKPNGRRGIRGGDSSPERRQRATIKASRGEELRSQEKPKSKNISVRNSSTWKPVSTG